MITSVSNETPTFELQAIDTLECTRFHGDSLPEGISEENVVEVRELLAHDYAQSFQVFNYNLTPHNFRCSTSACPLISRMQEGCSTFGVLQKPKNRVVANDRLVMIPFVDMMYNCPPSMFHVESSQALDGENCKRLTPRDFAEKRSLAASRWNIGERVGGGIVGSCQRQAINATPCSASLFWSRCHHHASLRYKNKENLSCSTLGGL